MSDYYGARIYEQMQTLNQNFSNFFSLWETFTGSVNSFFAVVEPLLRLGLLFVGCYFILHLFFPRWGQ